MREARACTQLLAPPFASTFFPADSLTAGWHDGGMTLTPYAPRLQEALRELLGQDSLLVRHKGCGRLRLRRGCRCCTRSAHTHALAAVRVLCGSMWRSRAFVSSSSPPATAPRRRRKMVRRASVRRCAWGVAGPDCLVGRRALCWTLQMTPIMASVLFYKRWGGVVQARVRVV